MFFSICHFLFTDEYLLPLLFVHIRPLLMLKHSRIRWQTGAFIGAPGMLPF